MTDCMIVTTLAEEFAVEIQRLTVTPITVKACTTAQQARDEYGDEKILFGSPGMIAEILPSMPEVNWVQSSWAGATPLLALPQRDYVLTGIKEVFGPQMAEYVVGYLLAHELKIMQRASAQAERLWESTYSGTLAGKCLGIMGTGSIGRHIAKTAALLGLTVTGLSRSGDATPDFATVYPTERLAEFLPGCDYLVSTLPQTSATNNLLNATTLALLPKHAYFVNVGRGNVVDDQALVGALQDGALAGATLDVFDEEPLPQESALWATSNLHITPHIAAISHPLLIVPIFVENYQRYIAGKPLQHVIDFDDGY